MTDHMFLFCYAVCSVLIEILSKNMEIEEIKYDFDCDAELQCCLCLSMGRKLAPLGDLTNIYLKITEGILNLSPEIFFNTEVCWECKNILRKVLNFQKQVVKAKELLKMGQNYIYGPLSTLTSVTLSETKNTIYLNENYNKLNINIDNNTCLKNFQSKEILHKKSEITEETFATQNISNSDNRLNNVNNRTYCSQSKETIQKIYENRNSEITEDRFETENTELQNDSKNIEISDNENFDDSDLNLDTKISIKDQFNCHKKGLCEKELSKSTHRLKRKKAKFKMCSINSDEIFHIGSYKDIECKMCEKSIQTENVKKHFQNMHKSVFQCLRCDLKFCNRRTFFAHYKEWHEKFICDHCGVSFKMRYSIKKHISKQHSPLKCHTCDKSFKTYSGYWRHNKLEHTPASPAYCVECDKSYKDVYRYKWHLCNSVKHASRKKKILIPCTKCDKVFTKKTNMTEHYDLVHLKIYRYRCEICDKNYVRNADLMKHKRRNHEGILPPKDKICNVCGRGFTTNTILKNHQRTHSRERGMINKN